MKKSDLILLLSSAVALATPVMASFCSAADQTTAPPKNKIESAVDWALSPFSKTLKGIEGHDIATFKLDDRSVGPDGKKVWGINNKLLFVRSANKEGTQGLLVNKSTGTNGYEYDARCPVTMEGPHATSLAFDLSRNRSILNRINNDQMILMAGRNTYEESFVINMPWTNGAPIFTEDAYTKGNPQPFGGTTDGTRYTPADRQCHDVVNDYNRLLNDRLWMLQNEWFRNAPERAP